MLGDVLLPANPSRVRKLDEKKVHRALDCPHLQPLASRPGTVPPAPLARRACVRVCVCIRVCAAAAEPPDGMKPVGDRLLRIIASTESAHARRTAVNRGRNLKGIYDVTNLQQTDLQLEERTQSCCGRRLGTSGRGPRGEVDGEMGRARKLRAQVFERGVRRRGGAC